MNLHAKLALGVVVVGVAAMSAYKLASPYLQDQLQRATSDARDVKGKLTVGTDNWVGYVPLCSSEMKKELRRHGYLLQCEDDKADYPGRMQRLKSGDLQFAVATVDAYVLNGAAKGYPGSIVAVLDESKGGDAIVAWKDQLARVEDLKRATGAKIAFTPNSPSEHLLKAVAAHFDVPALKQRNAAWRLEASGSPDALDKLLSRKAAAAVLWEPDVSRALSTPGVVKLLGSEDTKRLIVDVLLVNREFAQRDPEAVNHLLAAYFQVLQGYGDNRDKLAKDAREATDLSPDQVAVLLKGVRWTDLAENAQVWLGGASGEGLADVIESAARIQIDAGDFKDSPVPDRDPFRLIDSQFALRLFAASAAGPAKAAADSGLARPFRPLDAKTWASLKEVGTLKTRPVVFQTGTADLSYEGKQELDSVAASLRHYPNFRILVKGHTGVTGNPDENRRLSHDRAEAVARYLAVTYNMDSNRLQVLAFGGEQPLPRLPDESDRAYGYRLPRVELTLVSEAL